MIRRSPSALPTLPAPTGEDWLPLSIDGRWWWDGSRWRRTVESPWPATHTRTPARPFLPARFTPRLPARWPRVARALVLVLFCLVGVPIIVLGGALVEILGRGLAAAARVVVGVLAFGVMIGLLAFVVTHF